MAETTKKPKASIKAKKAVTEKAVTAKPVAKKAVAEKVVTKKPAAPKAVAKKAAPKTGIAIVKPIPQESVAALAHRFWAERGYQHGQHIEDWFRAEQELRGKAS